MKKIYSILLIVLLVLTMAACTKDNRSSVFSDANMVTVSISIDAKMAHEKGYVDYEYILENTEVQMEEGSTVWDVLNKIAKSKNIPVVKKGSGKHLYVSHINSIGEFDFEKGSGWNYNINGVYPNYGCDNSKATLEDGDAIEWRFTFNLGKDLGAPQG